MPDTDLDQAIDDRIQEQNARAYLERNALPQPEVKLSDLEQEWHDKNQARIKSEREAAAAAEARQRAECEAAEAERRRLYEENAPQREAAQTELAQLEPALAVVDGSAEKMRDRRRELLAEIGRWGSHDGAV